jgi:flavin reductase (DIM6/NTAB) family NADH-FMN oxidoreductase RutF
MSNSQFSDDALRKAFSFFPSGVTAICAYIDDEPVGMAASSFTSVSLQPPLVSVCIARSSETWARLRLTEQIGISVLASHHDLVCRQLAAKSGNRFADVDWYLSPEGVVRIEGAALHLDVSLHSELPGGDHDIALFRVERFEAEPEVPPLVFHRSRFVTINAMAEAL